LHSRYADARGHSIGKTPLVFLNSSTCIAIAKSIHYMHVTIFHVGKHKRHFSNTVQLTCYPFSKQPLIEMRMQCTQRISYAVKFTGHRQLESRHTKLESMPKGGRLAAFWYSACSRKKTSLFSCHYLRNSSNADIGVFLYRYTLT